MTEEYHDARSHLVVFLRKIAKQSEASCLQIMSILRTELQVMTMMDYIYKRKNEPMSREQLVRVALAISRQVK